MVEETTQSCEDSDSSGAHIPSLRIEGYRGIRKLDVPRLARVNLFAGDNGCGKSSLLEAITWFIVRQRAKHSNNDPPIDAVARDEPEQDFYGDEPGALSGGAETLDGTDVKGLVAEYVGKDRPYISRRHDEMFHYAEHGIFPPRLAEGEGFSDAVIHAGQIAEPELVDIKFDLIPQRRTGIRHDCLMAVMSNGDKFPIAGLGAGARHMMAIMSRLARAPSRRNSKPIFLADEIDEGLHRKIHSGFWRLLIREAVDRNVQLFATTHSWDCVSGFGTAGTEFPDWTARFFRLEKGEDPEEPGMGKSFAVDYSPEVLASAIRNRFDPR